jgi:hypothetical protein
VVKAKGQEHNAVTASEEDEATTQYYTGWVEGRIETDVVVCLSFPILSSFLTLLRCFFASSYLFLLVLYGSSTYKSIR